MDTRLKNRHRLGISVSLLVVLIASVAMVGMYPYMISRTRQYLSQTLMSTDDVYSNTKISEFAVQVMNSVYEAWREQKQEETQRPLMPSEVFLPDLEGKRATEENADDDDVSYYYDSLKETMDGIGNEWEKFAREYAGSLKYKMTDASGKILRFNVNDPGKEFAQTLGTDEILLEIAFNSAGALKLGKMTGVQDPNLFTRVFNKYEFYDPLAIRVGSEYRQNGVTFSGPKDVIFTYKCNLSEFYGIYETQDVVRPWDLQVEGTLDLVVVVLCLIVALCALVLPFFPCFAIGDGVLFRVSLEPLVVILTLGYGCAYGSGLAQDLILNTWEGTLASELAQIGFLAPVSRILVVGINLLYWGAVFGMTYWGMLCARAVFILGPWRYFKERTWLGRMIRALKRWVVRCLNPFYETDWSAHSTKTIGKAVFANFVVLALISCLWFFGIAALVIYSFALFFFLVRVWKQQQEKYGKILDAVNQMAEGNLDVEVSENLGLFEPLKEDLFKVRKGFKKAVEQEVKSERTKAELITNVSHDLKTPLTAIITYVNLLKQPNLTEEQRKDYIEVLDKKSMRLKGLIEDLFEVSKANAGAVNLELHPIDLVSLIKEVRLELSERIEASEIEFRWDLPDEKVVVNLDGQRTYRIFENLLVNIIKYAMPKTRAYVDMSVDEEAGRVRVTLRNISEKELTVSADKLTERFVRGDQSRSGPEGSGLGLAIAQSFTQLQGGTLEVSAEGDLFRVIVEWNLEKVLTEEEG